MAQQSGFLHELFDSHARKAPGATAIVSKHIQCTYGLLYHVTNRLAAELQKKEVGPDVVVGVCLPNSEGMVISILAIMKAGGAYLPIYHKFPKSRIEYLVTDSRINLVITSKQYSNFFPHTHVILIEDYDQPFGGDSKDEIVHSGVTAENLAYCIYTSGSTGSPKGAQIEHRALNSFIENTRDIFHPNSTWRILQYSAITFDAYIWEIVCAFAFGATLVIADEDERIGQDLANVIEANKITACLVPPSVWQTVPVCPLPSLTTLIMGGEVCPPSLAEKWFQQEDRHFYNVYGPAEATVVSTIFEFTPNYAQTKLPIGKPLNNVRVYILDEDLNQVENGEMGEICISGLNVGQGYHHRPDLTRVKFIQNPFEGGNFSRMYRTGDIGKILPDGAIDFCGRRDFQVKVNGVRIELEEIEASLRTHPHIYSVAVIAKDHPTGKKLVAYYSLRISDETQQPPNSTELLEYTQKLLPPYMIPSLYICLPSLPMNTSGKVDRQHLIDLPIQIGHNFSETNSQPTTPVQSLLISVWREALHLDAVGIEENFFALGGGSLSAYQVASVLNHKGVRGIDAYDLYRCPTIRKLADLIESSHNIDPNETQAQQSDGAHWARPSAARQYLVEIALSRALASLLRAEAVHPEDDCIEILATRFHPLSQLGFLDRFVQEAEKSHGAADMHLGKLQIYNHRTPHAIAAFVARAPYPPPTILPDSLPVGDLEVKVLAAVRKVLVDESVQHHTDIYDKLQDNRELLKEELRIYLPDFKHPIPSLTSTTTSYQVALALRAANSARILAHPPSAFVLPLCVPPQATKQTPALILAHPALRTSLSYKALSRMFGDGFSVYGLEESGAFQQYDNIHEMAKRYAESCEAFFTDPAQPLILAGWSFGAALAHELAAELTHAGRTVRCVCVLDGAVPVKKDLDPIASRVQSIILVTHYLDVMMGGSGSGGGKEKIVPPMLVPLVVKSVMAGEEELSEPILDLFMTPYATLMPSNELRVYVARFYKDLLHAQRLANYDAACTVSWKTVVFRVKEKSDGTDGWMKLSNVVFVEVPGTHYDMIFPPHAQALAAAMLRNI